MRQQTNLRTSVVGMSLVLATVLSTNAHAWPMQEGGGLTQVGPISEEWPTYFRGMCPTSGNFSGTVVQAGCTGDYCDNNFLVCSSPQGDNGDGTTARAYENISYYHWKTVVASGFETDPMRGVCDLQWGMVGLEAFGSYSDNLSVGCSPVGWILGKTLYCRFDPMGAPYYYGYSDETGYSHYDYGWWAAGMRCSSTHCDNMDLYRCTYQ